MKVYHFDWSNDRNYAVQSTLKKYRESEGQPGISHTEQSVGEDGMWCHWLKTTSMSSWMILTDSPIPPDLGV